MQGNQTAGTNQRTVMNVIEFDRLIAVVAVEKQKVQAGLYVIGALPRAVHSTSFGQSRPHLCQNCWIVRVTFEGLQGNPKAGRPLGPETVVPSLLRRVTGILDGDKGVDVQN